MYEWHRKRDTFPYFDSLFSDTPCTHYWSQGNLNNEAILSVVLSRYTPAPAPAHLRCYAVLLLFPLFSYPTFHLNLFTLTLTIASFLRICDSSSFLFAFFVCRLIHGFSFRFFVSSVGHWWQFEKNSHRNYAHTGEMSWPLYWKYKK